MKDTRTFKDYWQERGFTDFNCATMNEEENTTFNIGEIVTEYMEEQKASINIDAMLKANRVIQSELGKDSKKEVKAFAKKLEISILDLIKDEDEKFFNSIVVQTDKE